MTDHLAAPLTDDESTVLQIAAQHGTVGAIGRWEEPVKSLVKRGLLQDLSGDYFNCRITEAGKSVHAGAESEEDKALGRTVDRMRDMAIAQRSIQEMAEQCAQVLVKIAEASSIVAGDAKGYAAEQWSKVILTRAKELLR